MRDTRKDQKYFDEYLGYQKTRIEKKVSKLSDCDEEKKQRILVSLTGYEIDLLKAEFSAGADFDELRTEYEKAIHLVCDYESMAYEDILFFLSFTILFGNNNDVVKMIQKNEKAIVTDRLLLCLSVFIKTGKVTWDKNVSIIPEYNLLDDVFESNNRDMAMRRYLERWYSNHIQCAWYDSHLKDTDTYCGYWCFEAAAIVKMLSMNSEDYNGIQYYPSF